MSGSEDVCRAMVMVDMRANVFDAKRKTALDYAEVLGDVLPDDFLCSFWQQCK